MQSPDEIAPHLHEATFTVSLSANTGNRSEEMNKCMGCNVFQLSCLEAIASLIMNHNQYQVSADRAISFQGYRLDQENI
jgi:hypothetical protein